MRVTDGHRLARVAVVLVFLAMSGCGSRTPAPTRTPTPAATSTPTRTPTPAATSTPARTPTPALSPTPTSGPAPAATQVTLGWNRQFGSPAWDRGNAVTVDGSGNIIVGGATQGALPGQTLHGDWDAYMVKLSPDGTEQWTTEFTNFVSVGVLTLAVDGTGNIIAAGHVVGHLVGQPGVGEDDAWVRKYSPAGTETWTREFGSGGSEWALGVAVDKSGNIILVGATEGAFPGQFAHGYEDAWVTKLTPAGDALWTRQIGSPQLDRFSRVAVDGAGNIIVAGRVQVPPSSMEDPSQQDNLLEERGVTPPGSEAWVVKFSPDGTELWSVRFGSPGYTEAADVAVDTSGNVIVVGHIIGTLPGQTRAGYDDAFVRKLNPAGEELWTSQFGSTTYSGALAVTTDASGDILVTGSALGALPGQTRIGLSDAFVRKLSPAGVELWTIQFGSLQADAATAVAVDGQGRIIVVGETYGAMPGQTQAGLGDTFVVRLEQPQG